MHSMRAKKEPQQDNFYGKFLYLHICYVKDNI